MREEVPHVDRRVRERCAEAVMRRCGARAGSGGGCKREEGLGWCRNLYTVGLVLGFGCGLPALRSVRVDGVYGRDEGRKQFERVRWTWSATHRQRKAYGCLRVCLVSEPYRL
jgi:hypothetical protein